MKKSIFILLVALTSLVSFSGCERADYQHPLHRKQPLKASFITLFLPFFLFADQLIVGVSQIQADAFEDGYKTLLQDCKEGVGDSCAVIAEMHLSGLGIPRDTQKGLKFLDIACGLSHMPSCFVYAQKLQEHKEPPIQEQLLIESLYKKCCDADLAEGCFYYATLQKEPHAKNEALKKSCSLHYYEACEAMLKAPKEPF